MKILLPSTKWGEVDRQLRQKTDESRVKILVLLLAVLYLTPTASTPPGR